MKEVRTITVHQYDSELLVELIGTDERGEVAAETVQLDLLDPENGKTCPRGELPDEHEERVRSLLSERGYSLDET